MECDINSTYKYIQVIEILLVKANHPLLCEVVCIFPQTYNDIVYQFLSLILQIYIRFYHHFPLLF
ncbi:hypothetical protein THF5H11_20279 [Vibrio jasicida]|nr:hypothetical protein THF5H11_20279 [Vibrio jasicida]